jgi:VIT1/CCC1 family predicted Fe2+/Mn2+ transporter
MEVEIPTIIEPRENDTGEDIGHVHYSHRAQFLRALIMGVNDGIVSTAALLIAINAGEHGDNQLYILTGVSGIAAGALSMACGEYVSVASQHDSEQADIAKEAAEQEKGPEARARELEQLVQIYEKKGLERDLAEQVAVALTEHDVLAAHCLEEHGIDIHAPKGCGAGVSNPIQAAVVSFFAFIVGGSIPFLSSAWFSQGTDKLISLIVSTLITLGIFGATGSLIGGSSVPRGTIRVLIGGGIALGISWGIGYAIGISL